MARRVFGAALAACLVLCVQAQTCTDISLEKPQILSSAEKMRQSFMGHYVKVDEDTVIAGAYGFDSWRGAIMVFKMMDNGGFEQVDTLKPPRSEAGAGSFCGLNVDIVDQNTIAMGCPYAKLDGRTVGRAYLWKLNSTSGKFEMTSSLTEPVPTKDARYGYSVAVSRDLLFVGARYATNEQNGKENAGAVYVYRLNSDGETTFLQKLRGTSSNAHWSDELVYRNGILAVGAPRKKGGEGRAYIFKREDNDSFTQEADLSYEPPSGVSRSGKDHFSEGLAITDDGRTLVIGGEGANSPGCNGTGAAYIFERSGDGEWSQKQGLYPTGCGRVRFAQRIAIHGDVIAVSGFTSGAAAQGAGAMYLFRKCSDGTWQPDRRMVAPNASAFDQFSKCVALSDKYLIAGAPRATSVAGDDDNKDGVVISYRYGAGGDTTGQDDNDGDDDETDDDDDKTDDDDTDNVWVAPVGTIVRGQKNYVPVRYSTERKSFVAAVVLRTEDLSRWLASEWARDLPSGEGQTTTVAFTAPSDLKVGSTVAIRADLRPRSSMYSDHYVNHVAYAKVIEPSKYVGFAATPELMGRGPNSNVPHKNVLRLRYYAPATNGEKYQLVVKLRRQGGGLHRRIVKTGLTTDGSDSTTVSFNLGSFVVGKEMTVELYLTEEGDNQATQAISTASIRQLVRAD